MKIAVINDLSGMGRCSLTASIPMLNILGHQVFPVPTAILSNQTGYPKFSFFDFTDHMDEYISNWKDMGIKFDVIYSGFLSNQKQVQKIKDMHKYIGVLYSGVCNVSFANDKLVEIFRKAMEE